MKKVKFQDIAGNYKAIFLDSYGVLRNYEGLIDGVPQVLQGLQDRGIKYFVLTNDASRSPSQLVASFHRLGLDLIGSDYFISSGMLAAEYLQHKIGRGRVAYLGTENCAHYIESVGIGAVSISDLDIEDAGDMRALVFMDDEGMDWNVDINKALNFIRRYNVPVICANTDEVYPKSKRNVSLAVGAIADMMEVVTRKNIIRFGKPDSQMFNFAFNHIQGFARIEKDEVLMVGDTLQTDILGANKFGLDTLLVLSGNTLEENLEVRVRSTGIVPDFYCNSLGD